VLFVRGDGRHGSVLPFLPFPTFPEEKVHFMRFRNSYAAAVAAAVCAVVFSAVFQPTEAVAITIDWVTVGNPGNADDPATGNLHGAVADEFQIMKFEFTNQQYTEFLNSVDANGTNPNSVYNAGMGSDVRGGISFTSGNANGSKYAVKTNMGDKPVNFISWWEAARVSNWLMNGATGTSSMETGAYTLNNAISGSAPARNSGATYYVPTEDQWYKAAFYSPVLNSGSGGYYTYATQSNIVQTAVQATTTGVGRIGAAGTTPVTSGNFANFNSVADWGSPVQNGNVTTVGTNGGPSYYGAFDMGGNVVEWNDFAGAAELFKQRRGGNWSLGADRLPSSQFNDSGTDTETNTTGFRLVAVPEPSTWVMGLAGIACVAWRSVRRRRAR
jgi:formylglycine-generating enzyme